MENLKSVPPVFDGAPHVLVAADYHRQSQNQNCFVTRDEQQTSTAGDAETGGNGGVRMDIDL